MKTIFFNLLSLVCCVAALVGCSYNEDPMQGYESGHIVLDFSASAVRSRATVEADNVESAVDHLDVFIFEKGTTVNPIKHYERITTSAERAVINKPRSWFDSSKTYWVYVLANCSISSSELESEVATLADLKQIQQRDDRIHITGISGIEGAPQRFLMDGVAHKGVTEPSEPAAVQLFDGNLAANTELSVTLRRAAAKIFITIKRGKDVTFSSENEYLAGYYVHNLPCSSPLVAGVAPDAVLRSPDKTNNEYFDWGENAITIKAYAYSHDFTHGSIMENRTTMVVDIPMVCKGVEYPNNYYQIPISKNHKLERNTYYAVTVVLNAPGAEDVSHPVEVEPMIYNTADWTTVNVSVGGEADTPKYLNVSREEMDMRYITTDNTSLYFASSSEVSINVLEAYYINKMGNRIDVDNATRNQIKGSVEEGELTGNITITSPMPTNKTIRYIRFQVTNEDGFSREVLVSQYPLEYITNIQSWYSYRDDFKDEGTSVTTYENPGSRETAVSLEVQTTGSGWNQVSTWTGNYTYHKGSASSGFWRSKVVTQLKSDGSSTIGYYYWTNNTTKRTSTASASTNARMYHIRITSTSSEYKLGNPKLTDDGFTDPCDENALLVSPSFMIASGLGYVDSNTGNMQNMNKDSDEFRDIVRDHCSKYVEVYKDPVTDQTVVLDDWRLPTTAELSIIMNYQGTQGSNADAIDYLLNASYYWSASGRIYNPKEQGSNGITAFRCIRDAVAR